MRKVITIRRSPQNKLWLGYVAGKLLPLVCESEDGTTADSIYRTGREHYPELKLDPDTAAAALETLAEIGHAVRVYRPASGKTSDGITRYKLTTQGACLLAVQFMSNQPGLSIELA